MAIQYDPRLQGKPNTTDILTGQEDMQQEAQNQPVEAPQPLDNTQAAPPQQSAPQSNIATKKPSSSSGMFTNVRQYVEKNKPAAQNMAKSIGSTVQRSADIARKNIQSTQGQFENLREQGSLQNRDTAVQDVRSAAERAAGMSAPRQVQAGMQTEGQRTEQTSGPQMQITDQPIASNDDRIKAILDAQYQGPQRLEELGNFGNIQRKTQEAERLRQQLTSGNRQELLDKSLERQGSKYTQGARRLDELLFGQGQPQEYLQNVQSQIGDVGQDLMSASQSARQDAIERAREISDIRSQARGTLQTTAEGRAKEVQDIIADQIAQGGQLADYYKNILSQSEGGLDLGAVEAATLGVKSGAGLYNLLSDPIERESILSNLDARDRLQAEKLISRDEQAQLAELQRLAQLSSDYGVADSGLDFRSDFQDADLAGTQSALAALNLEGFGDALTGAEKSFREQAAMDQTGQGFGKEKYNRGFGRGRKTVKRYATESGNLRDILEGQGYDFSSDPSQYVTDPNANLLSDLSQIANISRSGENIDFSDPDSITDSITGLSGISEDSLLFDNQVMNSLGLSPLSSIMTPQGLVNTGANLASGFGEALEGARGFEQFLGADNSVIGDILASPGTALKGLGDLASSISSGIAGGDKKAAQKKAAAEARAAALRNLQDKLTGQLSSSGFANRVNVADTAETRQRQSDLMKLLGNIRQN